MKKWLYAMITGLGLMFSPMIWANETDSLLKQNGELSQQLPPMQAQAYALYDESTQTMLLEKNSQESIVPASFNKLMGLYLTFEALENGKLSLQQELSVPKNAWQSNGARIFLKEKEKISVNNLLNGVIVASGNDAMLTLAAALGGEQEFINAMNAMAKKLDMPNTHFASITGQENESRSTVADLLRLSQAIMQNYPQYLPLFRQQSFTYNHITQTNPNLLLFRSPQISGLFTAQSAITGQFHQITTIQLNNQNIIAIVIGADSEENRANESSALSNFLLQNFAHYKIYEANSKIAEIPVQHSSKSQIILGVNQDIFLLLPKNNADSIRPVLEIPAKIEAPIKQGDQLGKVKLFYQDTLLQEISIFALEDAEKLNFFQRLWQSILKFLNEIF